MTKRKAVQRERALTIYFATTKEKADFVKAAEGFGLTASTLGGLMIYKAIEDGFMDKLRAALPEMGEGVKSGSTPSGHSPHSRTKTKTQSERRPTKSPVKG